MTAFAKLEPILPAFLAAVDAYANKALVRLTSDEHAAKFATKHEIMRGPKYIRVVKTGAHERSVYCFLDAEGNVYKAAGWKAPAKGIRGNILADENFSLGKGLSNYGGAYANGRG